MKNILVLFASRTWPMRASQRDHLWAFRKYAEYSRVFYVNLAFGGFPTYLQAIPFDLVVFDWTYVGTRVDRDWFMKSMARIQQIKAMPAVKVTMPQDEFSCMDLMCELISAFNIEVVFSVAPESQWQTLYRTVDPRRVRFVRVLTGYLDEDLVKVWAGPGERAQARILDIGYRTVSDVRWGRFNLLKGRLADVFAQEAERRGWRADIKVGPTHFKMGDDWLRFLTNCRFTLGVEGGSSVLDWDGSLSRTIDRYLVEHPGARVDDVAAACIPLDRDGEVDVVAISPRHLEACLTRTGQVLIEGHYNGILTAERHYIPLRRDLSNLDEVCQRMTDEGARVAMVDRAFDDVVKSGRYTYRSMVDAVMAEVGAAETHRGWPVNSWVGAAYLINKVHLLLSIAWVSCYSLARDARDRFKRWSIATPA